MALKLFPLFSVLAVLTSCKAQNNSQAAGSPHSIFAIGDTVSELDKAILVIFQDRHHNYWFGSNGQGIYRYDPRQAVGKNLIHFTAKDRLCSNQIRDIQEDKSGNIYFTTFEGISKFDGQRFTTLMPTKNIFPTNEWKLQPDDLWFKGASGAGGAYRYDGKGLYFLKFPKHYLENEFYAKNPNVSYSPYDVYTIYKDSKGHIWFGTSNLGLCRYDGKSIKWLYEKELTETPSGGSFGIRSILEDKEGKFWFCNTRYRYTIDPPATPAVYENDKGKDFINYKREKGIDGIKTAAGEDLIYYLSIAEDSNRNLWMVTYTSGVWQYDGQKITHHSVKDGTKDSTLFSIYKDRQGTLWLGTHKTGVYQFNGKAFEKFKL
ncbi:MAG: two-component regulator propeller domain-containing protein [Spirosomataceae bacterium]